MPAEQCPARLEMRRGDTTIFYFTSVRVTDATTNPVTTTPWDLTSATIYFTAKEDPQDSDADAVFQKSTSSGITITSAANGLYYVKIASSDTSGLDLSCDGFLDLYYDVEVVLGATNGGFVSGDKVTLSSGTLTVFVDRTLT